MKSAASAALFSRTVQAKNAPGKPPKATPISALYPKGENSFLRILGGKVDAKEKRLDLQAHEGVDRTQRDAQTHRGARANLRGYPNRLREEHSHGLSPHADEPLEAGAPKNEPDEILKDGKMGIKRRTARARLSPQETPTVLEFPDEPHKKGNAGSTAKQAELPLDALQSAARAAPTLRGHEPSVFILDLRRKTVEKAGEEAGAVLKAPRAITDRDPQAPLSLRPAPSRETAASGPQTLRSAPATPFAGALERLREMAGSELVRATGIILKDGGGEIRLVLKPESLGNIRIRMNLVDNSIEGRIIVDNASVKQALDGSLDSLTRALTAQGFQTASLEVSVGGQGADNGRAEQEPTAALRRKTVQGFERNLPGVENVSLGDLLVNLLV